MYGFRVVIGLCALVTSVSCAVYHAQPLEDRELQTVLAPPDSAALERAAPLLQHPRLLPMRLDLEQPLTPDALAVISVLANPDLRALRAQQGVADAQVFASGLLPDPQFGIGRDRVSSAPDATFSAAWAGSLAIDLLGPMITRGAERGAAQAHATRVRMDIAWAEWMTAGQARLLTVRMHYQQRAAQLASAAAEVADRALARSLAAGERRDLKADEIELRRIADSDAVARALAVTRDVDATRLELNRLLGFPPEEKLSLASLPVLKAWRGADAGTLFTVARVARLDLRALAADYDSQQQVVRRAVLSQYPRVGLTLNRARDTSRVYTSGQAVSVDLPLWNRSRGVLRVAEADRAQLRAEYAARLHQTRADIAALVAALEIDERARVVLEAQAPELERIAAAYEAAAIRGDATWPVAEAVRAAALDRSLTLLALQQACAEERVGLLLAVGQPLTDLELVP